MYSLYETLDIQTLNPKPCNYVDYDMVQNGGLPSFIASTTVISAAQGLT